MGTSSKKTKTRDCALDPARAEILHSALGRSGPPPTIGSALNPFWHQIYFWESTDIDNLGRDGHPKTGDFIPDLGLPRRMWAGGDLIFHQPLIIGKTATKSTAIDDVTTKTGRSGALAFVTLRHDIHQNNHHCITEYQNLVYRNDPDINALAPRTIMARTDEVKSEIMTFNSTLLFRYSALTNNGHRIHYDLEYCRDVEGYDGLVVHGPLLAHFLMDIALKNLGPLKRFSFKATSPLLHSEQGTFCINGTDLWVRGPDGRQCMIASAA